MLSRRHVDMATYLLLVLLVPLMIVSLSIEWTLRSDWPTAPLRHAFPLQPPLAEAQELHRQVMDFYFHAGTLTAFSAPEQAHFSDVKRRLDGNRMLAYLSLVLCLILMRVQPRRWRALGQGCLLLVGMLAGFGLLASRWILLFRGLHPLLFAEGGWDFSPTHLMVRLYPSDYLGGYGAAILGGALLFTLLLYLWARAMHPHRQAGHWRGALRAREGLMLLVIGCLLVVGAGLAGTHMFVPADPAWWLFYALCLGVLASSAALALVRPKLPALLACLFSVLLYQGFASGVRYASAQQQQWVLQQGQILIQAVANYHREQQRLPPSLAALIPRYLTTLPQTAPDRGWWYELSPDGRHYRLGMAGPLAFHNSYRSIDRHWNLLSPP